MKITCLKDQLKEKSLIAERIANKSNVLPILNSMLLSTEKNHLKIISTNLETGFEALIPAKIEKEGKVAISAKILSSFLNSLTENDKITLEEKNRNLFLSTQRTATTIKGYPVEEFPIIPSVKKQYSFILPASDFLSGIKSVFHAVSVSDIKPEIASILIEGKKNEQLKFAATDSFRLAEKKMPDVVLDSNFSLLIPYRSAAEIIKIFNEGDYDVEIFSDKNQVLLAANQSKFVSKITEGVFPDYVQVIPKSFATEVSINKGLLIDAVKTAGIFSGRLNNVNLKINTAGNLCNVETSHSDLGEYKSEIPVEAKGDNVDISFNYNYLLNSLQYIFSEKVSLGINGASRPMILKGEPSYFCLIMPMKNI